MTSRDVIVVNQLGMHARAAAKFVHLAGRFQAHVRVAREAREMDGKSIMGILLLAAGRGTTITISADGIDEGDAVNALAALVASGFGEEAPAAGAEGGARSASGPSTELRVDLSAPKVEWGSGPTSGEN